MEGNTKLGVKEFFFQTVPLEFLSLYVNDFFSFKIQKEKKSHKTMIN